MSQPIVMIGVVQNESITILSTEENKSYCEITLLVKTGDKQELFPHCIFSGPLAKTAADFLQKEDLVLVTGKLKIRKRTVNGHLRQKIYFEAQHLELLAKKKREPIHA